MVNRPEYQVGQMIKESPEAREAYREIKKFGYKPYQIRDWILEFAPQSDHGSPSQCAWIISPSRKITKKESMKPAIEPFEIVENQGWQTSQDVADVLKTWAKDLEKARKEKPRKTELSDMDRLRAYEKWEEKKEEQERAQDQKKMIRSWNHLWQQISFENHEKFQKSFKEWIEEVLEKNEWIVTATGNPLFEFIDKFEASTEALQAMKKADPERFKKNLIHPLQRLKKWALVYPYDDPEVHEAGRDEALSLHSVIELLKNL